MNQEKLDKSFQPLATRMRPKSLSGFIGQSHLLGAGKPLNQAMHQGVLHSMILWGPPGTGKTTLAQLMAERTQALFVRVSAIFTGVKELRKIIEEAKLLLKKNHQKTILFIDEIHRFNKAQQDVFLPFIEDGTFTLIGATTENPSFELNNALLSRTRVYTLKRLSDIELQQVLQMALTNKEYGLGNLSFSFPKDLQQILVRAADGDARQVLNLLEIIADLSPVKSGKQIVDKKLLAEVLQTNLKRFDKQGEVFYDQISALHKAVRGSSPDAALYWLCRMLDGGCDPLYIARRVMRMAAEDIGLSDPRALEITLTACKVYERLGSPEGELAIAQAVLYLACTTKSNAVYLAYNEAMQEVKEQGSLEVPLHLRNAPTELMKNLGYGKDYRYAHDEPEGYAANESYFPDQLKNRIYYRPKAQGIEAKIAKRLAYFRELDKKNRNNLD